MAAADQAAQEEPRRARDGGVERIRLWSGLRLLFPFARYGWGGFAAASLLAALSALASLGPFWALYLAVRDIVAGDASLDAMYRYALMAAGFVAAQYVLEAIAGWTSHRGAFAAMEHLRLRIGRRLGQTPLGFLTNRRSGEVQRTLSDDVERLELFLAHVVPDIVAAAATLLFTVIWLFIIDWRMALVGLVVVAVGLPLMGIGTTVGSVKLAQYTRYMAVMNASIGEFIQAMPVVRTFNGTRRVFGETKSAIENVSEHQAQWGREFIPLYIAYYVVISSPILTIVPLGLLFWQLDWVDTATLLFFFIVGLGFTVPLLRLFLLMGQLSYLGLGARLVHELDKAGVLPERTDPVQPVDAGIEVDDVVFSYDAGNGAGPGSGPVLKGVSFSARPGSVTAIVGPSGGGKSTLARLMARFWDVDSGAIRIGGVDIRDMPISQLMDQIAFVFQETFLFNETVSENLRVAKRDAMDDEVVEAARSARAHEFIAALPQGYDTAVGELGARLSGGERQRLAVARALLKDAPIVILDEATAFADPENEVALQAAIDSLVSGKTVIVIAHRLSTVAGADQILVLDDGRIVERGRHEELIAQHGLYSELWDAFSSASLIALSGRVADAGPAVAGEGS